MILKDLVAAQHDVEKIAKESDYYTLKLKFGKHSQLSVKYLLPSKIISLYRTANRNLSVSFISNRNYHKMLR